MNSADSCLYVKTVKDVIGKINFVILALYVDDILLMSNSTDMVAREKESLSKRFNISDQGEVHFILGMLIQRDRKERTLTISQPKYLEGVLTRFKFDNCKQVSTSFEPGRKFEKLSDCDTPIDTQRYQMIIGCLTYASTATDPDIAAAVSILSQFMAKPGKQHWEGVKRVLLYIKETLDYCLKYSANEKEITLCGYSDADWGGDLNTRRSTSGYAFQINGCTRSWSSKGQLRIAKSSTEAKCIALSTSSQELIWLRRLRKDLGFAQSKPTVLFEDNQSANELSKNPKFHSRTKHIDISYHFVREQWRS